MRIEEVFMKSAVAELFSSEGVRPPKTFAQREAISERVVALLGGFVALLLVGCGLGWWIHPGAGLLVAGLVLWVELFLWSRTVVRIKK